MDEEISRFSSFSYFIFFFYVQEEEEKEGEEGGGYFDLKKKKKKKGKMPMRACTQNARICTHMHAWSGRACPPLPPLAPTYARTHIYTHIPIALRT